MAELKIMPPAAKYLKKLKDERLKKLYEEAIKAILENPCLVKKRRGI